MSRAAAKSATSLRPGLPAFFEATRADRSIFLGLNHNFFYVALLLSKFKLMFCLLADPILNGRAPAPGDRRSGPRSSEHFRHDPLNLLPRHLWVDRRQGLLRVVLLRGRSAILQVRACENGDRNSGRFGLRLHRFLSFCSFPLAASASRAACVVGLARLVR
jgi:hypothetical protein